MRKLIGYLLRGLPLYSCYLRYRIRQNFLRLGSGEARWLNFYRQFFNPGDLVFDVGANVGNRTKIFLKLNARVIAFEPENECIGHLKTVLKYHRRFVLIEEALGAKEEDAELLVGDANTLSTLSPLWIQSTQDSGRFSEHMWANRQRVHVTTLDSTIRKVGAPEFIKIDVEGYEYEVLCGLTQPIRCISIEFAAENIDSSFKCIDYMSSRWDVVFQFSEAESAIFYSPFWTCAEQFKQILAHIVASQSLAWGDIYIKQVKMSRHVVQGAGSRNP